MDRPCRCANAHQKPCFESVATVMDGGACWIELRYPFRTGVTPTKPAAVGIIEINMARLLSVSACVDTLVKVHGRRNIPGVSWRHVIGS